MAKGGKREGAGRPEKGNVVLYCHVKPETRALIKGWAMENGLTPGQVVDKLVEDIKKSST